eukprot:s185_g9.t1
MALNFQQCLQRLFLATFIATAFAADKGKGGWEETVNEEGKKVQSLKIEAPSMTEEDQYGYNMPDRYKCDSCRAALRKQQPKSRRLKSWEYTDLFEETCRSSFEGYGIKLVNGENVLSGPALKDNAELQPGMGAIQMGGDTWKKRLAEICRKLVFEEVGEEETYDYIYGKYKANDEVDAKAFCLEEVRHCQPTRLGPQPPPKATEEATKEPKPKKEKKPKGDRWEFTGATGVPTHVKKEYENTYDSFAWQSTAVGSTHSSQNVLTDWDDVKGEDVKEAWSWQEDDADAAEDAGLGADRHGDEDPQAESGFVLQTIQKSS